MLEFIKMFGLGIVYTILFPVLVVIFAVYLVYVLCNYLVIEIYNCVSYFFGYTFTTETKLEKELTKIKEEKDNNPAKEDFMETNDAGENAISNNEGSDFQ